MAYIIAIILVIVFFIYFKGIFGMWHTYNDFYKHKDDID